MINYSKIMQPSGNGSQHRTKVRNHAALGWRFGIGTPWYNAVQAQPMNQRGLPGTRRQSAPGTFRKDTLARRLVWQGQIDLIPILFRDPGTGGQKGCAHHVLAAFPNHKGGCVRRTGIQWQPQNPAMRFADHPLPRGPHRQNAVNMGGIAAQAIAKCCLRLIRPRPRIARTDHRNLPCMQRLRINWQCVPRKCNTIHRAVRAVWQHIHTSMPRAAATPVIRSRRNRGTCCGISGQRPLRDAGIRSDNRPTRTAYHPATVRNMFNATNVMNTANARLKGRASMRCASATPYGVVISVIAMIIKNAGKLTAPMVKGGA